MNLKLKNINNRKSQNGITLIALVITVIVLLILAGISIMMLTGDNSILKNATDAKHASTVGTIKDIIVLQLSNIAADETKNVKEYTDEEKIQSIMDELTKAGLGEENDQSVSYNSSKTVAIVGNKYVISLLTAKDAIEADPDLWEWVITDVDKKEVGICGYNGTEESITIPEYIKYNGEIYTVTALKNCGNDHSAFLISSESTGSDHRFKTNTVVKNITMLDNITLIDGSEFGENTTIENVTMTESVKEFTGTSIFSSCTNLKTCRLSNSITVIPRYMFQNCTLLEEVNIPKNATEIEEYAFNNVKSLEIVTIPKSVKKIGKSAFSGMGNDGGKLKRIIIEEGGLEEVGESAFASAGTVEEDLHLPSTLSSDKIGKNAFAGFGKSVYLFDGTKVSTSWQ